MRVIAIDPGYDRCGVAILDAKAIGEEQLIFSTCIQTDKKDSYYKRLKQIIDSVEEIINLNNPDFFAIENLFFNKNQKTATKVAETRGALLALALKQNLEIMEFTPLQIKLATTGNGRADKRAVYEILPHLLKIDKEIKLDDEFDAIACAITASALRKKRA